MSHPGGPPLVAVDARALVGEATGIGIYTRGLLAALAARPAARYLALSQAPITGADELRNGGVEIEVEPAPLGVWWQQRQLPRRLSAGDIDLLYSPLMTLPLRLAVPAVITIHDLTPILFPETHRLKVRLSILPFLARSIEAAHQVIADSAATAADLRFHFPQCADRLRVIYPGIEPEFRPAGEDEVAATRLELGLPGGYLLYAGTLEPRKNLPLLLDAWEALRRDDPATPPLVIAGGYGWRSGRLLRRMRALTDLGLHYLGRLERRRLVQVFQAATLFVYPSLYEGFGLPPAEAMACGVPTIASNRSSLPEVLGDGGLLFEPDSPEVLADRIRRLLAEPGLARELAERGRAQAERFTWEAAAARVEETFLEALG